MKVPKRTRRALLILPCALCVVGCVRGGFNPGTGRDIGTVDQPGAGDGYHTADQITDRPADQLVRKVGSIVPLYVDPPHDTWTKLVQAKQAHPTLPVVAVVNVQSGPGETSKAAYQTGIAALAQAGVVVIGYVWTNYGKRPAAEVKQHIDRWDTFYATQGLSGLFFDGQATAAELVPYYQDLTTYAKTRGFSFTVGDPGVDPAQGYVGVFDTMVIYQGPSLPPLTSLGGWHTNHDKKSFSILVYGVPTLDKSFVASARQYVGYLYLTDDGTPDPWDSLSEYFGDLLVELEK